LLAIIVVVVVVVVVVVGFFGSVMFLPYSQVFELVNSVD
jgi:hypothetical protein